MCSMKVPVKIYAAFNHRHGLPAYETPGAAGMDVRANESVFLRPGETRLIPTGIFVAIPESYEIQVRPRSGLSLKTKFRIANAPGTIDSDYLGELCIIAENIGNEEVFFSLGERIAQIVLSEVPQIGWIPVASRDELGSTVRGAGGFGSTDISKAADSVISLSRTEVASEEELQSNVVLHPMGSLGEEIAP